ncbi:MAG: hypothetical protein GC193_10890 [Cryomorphaceae bacterium]|nr:hypothetical protein [Cryomorphaceae bacterium]
MSEENEIAHEGDNRKHRFKKRIKYRVGAENDVERNARKQRESWEYKRQSLEKIMVPFAGIAGVIVIASVTINILAKWSCPICMWVVVIASILLLLSWTIIKTLELGASRKYHMLKKKRKLQEEKS